MEERRRNRQAERLGGLQVDKQFESGRLLDRKIARVRASQDLIDVDGGTMVVADEIRRIGHQTAGPHMVLLPIHCRQTTRCRKICDSCPLLDEHYVHEYENCSGPLLGHRRKGAVDLPRAARLQGLKSHPQCSGRKLRCSQLWWIT